MSRLRRNDERAQPSHGRDAHDNRAHRINGHGGNGSGSNGSGTGSGRRAMTATLNASSADDTAGESRTDEQLLLAYRQGDRASFQKLVERYQRELYHFLVRFLGDR